jgi:hypothetical protein
MLNFIDSYLLTPYIQVGLFILLLGLFWMQHRKLKLVSSGFNWLRTILSVLLFVYFAWNWATVISPLIARLSVLGMFFINLHMIYNCIIVNLDEKYRLVLEAYGQNPGNKPAQAAVWDAGKKYMYVRYFFDALFSGHSPGSFLKGVASRQIPADIRKVLIRQGVEKELITHKKLISFLQGRLSQSTELPPELKDILTDVIGKFSEHAWIQDGVDEFLKLAMTDPEKIYEGS